MNAPIVIPAVETGSKDWAEALTPAALGFDLFEAAMRGEIALSDHTACWAALRRAHPGIDLGLVYGARRVATDLVQHAARRPDAALVRACRAVRDVARGPLGTSPEGAELPDAHAVLARVGELLDGALTLTAEGGF